jgi:DNA-directed RNA polymerase specialized sigma24 family protein
MVPENSPQQPENSNSEVSCDYILHFLSDYGLSLDEFLKLISDAARRAFRIYHLRFNQADIEDIAQSIALLLLKDDCHVLRSFGGRSSPESWLQKIANHKTIRFYRRQKGMMSLNDLSHNDCAYSTSHDDKVLWDEIVYKLKLTKGQLELLELIYQGLKTKEIAERRGTKPDSVLQRFPLE